MVCQLAYVPEFISSTYGRIHTCKIKLNMLKKDEGSEKRVANIVRDTLLLTMATPNTLAKQRRRHPLKARCLHLTKKVLQLSKNSKRADFKFPRETARSLQFSRFFFEIWEREPAPARLNSDMTAIYGLDLFRPLSAAKCIGE
jgi:hypothetical protein